MKRFLSTTRNSNSLLYLQKPLIRFQNPLATQKARLDSVDSESSATSGDSSFQVMKNSSYFTEQVRWHKAICCLLEDKMREEFPQLKKFVVEQDHQQDLKGKEDSSNGGFMKVQRQQYGRVYPGSSTPVSVSVLQEEHVEPGQVNRKHKRQFEPHILQSDTVPQNPVDYQCSLTVDISTLKTTVPGFTEHHEKLLMALARLPMEPDQHEEHTHRPYEQFLMDRTFHPMHQKESNTSESKETTTKEEAYPMSQSVVYAWIEPHAQTQAPHLNLWSMRFPDYQQNKQYLQDTLQTLIRVSMAVEQEQPELAHALLTKETTASSVDPSKEIASSKCAFTVPKVGQATAEEMGMDFPEEWKRTQTAQGGGV